VLNDEIATYAVAIGLKTFVLAGPTPAEYRAQALSAKPAYGETERPVRTELEHGSRPRIRAPFRCFGHVVCTQPHVIEGIFWCTDLLGAGYLFAHVPTPRGRRKVVLPWQLVKNILNRPGLRSRSIVARPPQRKRDTSDRTARQPLATADAAFERLSKHQACNYQPQSDRILLIAANLDRGGAQRDMLITTGGLIQRDHDVRIITFSTSASGVPTFEEEIRKLGILRQSLLDFDGEPRGAGSPRMSNIASESAGLPRWFSNKISLVARAIQTHRPSIVHAWLDNVGLISALAAVSLGVPRIVVSFASMPQTYHQVKVSPLLRPGYAAVARNPDVVIVNNSAAGAAAYERWIGLPHGSIHIIRNAFLPGYQTRALQDEVARFRATLDATMERPIVGAVMRLSQEKDPALWLATAAEISKARPDALFAICGYGPAKADMERRIHELGLAGRARLVEPISDVGLYYQAFDVALLTSIVEGLPNMLIEAQAAGCPVVSTDVGGVREAISDGVTGMAVEPRSAQELAAAVLTILQDTSWRERARIQGPLFVAKNFGLKRMLDELVKVYRAQDTRL
jgi:glycosyltransferase involved in cell wall biosynthesis